MLSADQFVEEQGLGKGSFSSQAVFHDKLTGKRAIINQIPYANDSDVAKAHKEIITLEALRNDFVVRYFGCFPKLKKLNIVTEYCYKGDLQKYIERMKEERKFISEEEFFEYAAQLASGIAFLHKNKILHRNLKPSSIYISERGRLKIGEIGISLALDSEDYMNSMAEKRLFLSPEIIPKLNYTEKVDMWALGTILFCLGEIYHPFNTLSEIEYSKSITEKPPAHFVNIKNPSAQKLVLSLLDKNPAKRPSAEDVLKNPEIAARIDLWDKFSKNRSQFGSHLGRVSWLREDISENNCNSNVALKFNEIFNELTKILVWARGKRFQITEEASEVVCEVISMILTDFILPNSAWSIDVVKELQIVIGTLRLEAVKYIHINTLELFALIGPDSLCHEMLKLGILQSIAKSLKSEKDIVCECISSTINIIIKKEMKKIDISKINQTFPVSFEEEYLKVLNDEGVVKGRTALTKTNSAVALGWIFHGAQLPDTLSDVITHLKIEVKENCTSNQLTALIALCSLAISQQNHSRILVGGFIKDISQFLIKKKTVELTMRDKSLQFLVTLSATGDNDTLSAIQNFLPLKDLLLIVQDENSDISEKAKILCSWINCKDEMIKYKKLIQKYQRKNIEERINAIKNGALQDVCQMLELGKDGNSESEVCVNHACEFASILLDKNFDAMPFALEEGGFVDTLVGFLNTIPMNKVNVQHLKPIQLLKFAESEDQLRLLFEKGLIGALCRMLDSQNYEIRFKATINMGRILNAHKAFIGDGNTNPFQKDLERNGSIWRLSQIVKGNNKIYKGILKMASILLGFLYKSAVLPENIGESVIRIIGDIIMDNEDMFVNQALNSLSAIAECEDNHPAIISQNILLDVNYLLSSNEENICCATSLLCTLLANGNSETQVAVINSMQIDKIKELKKHSNKIIRQNSKELISWIVYPNYLKKNLEIIKNMNQNNEAEMSDLQKEESLEETFKLLKRIKQEEEDIEGSTKLTCRAISMLIERNLYLLPKIVEVEGILDLLIAIIGESDQEDFLLSQIETLYSIVCESRDELRKEIFSRGIIKSLMKHIQSKDQNVFSNILNILAQLAETGSSYAKDGELNKFKEQIETDEVIIKLIEWISIPDNINKEYFHNAILIQSFIFKASQLPNECSSIIINHLKTNSKNTDQDMSCSALTALTGLAECEANHVLIITDGFVRELTFNLKRKMQERVNIKILQLLLTLINHSSSELKATLISSISSSAVLQLTFCRNMEVSQIAQQLHSSLIV